MTPTSLAEADASATRSDADLASRVRALQIRDRAPPRSPLLPWVLAVLFAGSTAWLGYLRFSETREPPPAASARAAGSGNAVPVGEPPRSAGTGDGRLGAAALQSKGYIVPAHQILVSPKVAGMIVALFVEEGKRVNKGDVLAELETTEYEADFQRAQGVRDQLYYRWKELQGYRPEEIEQAERELAEWQSQLVQLEAEYLRAVDLSKRDVIPANELDLARSQYETTRLRVERQKLAVKLMKDGPREERRAAAKAELDQAEAELRKARWRLDNCSIRAPITGTILRKSAEEGNLVNPIAFNGSYALCEMADLSQLEVDLSIQERDIAQVFVGQKCTVRCDAFPQRQYAGVVDRLMPIADRSKATISVRVKILVPREEEGVYLKPEMGALVTFEPATEQEKKTEG